MRLNLDLARERMETTVIQEAKYKKKVEWYYNKRDPLVSFKVGDFVYRENTASRVEIQGKLGPNWEGPYRVTEAYENGSYKLATMNDREKILKPGVEVDEQHYQQTIPHLLRKKKDCYVRPLSVQSVKDDRNLAISSLVLPMLKPPNHLAVKHRLTGAAKLLRYSMLGKEDEVNILKSIDEGPFQMGTVQETLAEGNEGALHLGPKRARVYSDLLPKHKERYNADIQATNILLQGLPKDIYTLINHYTYAKDI
uniref:Reverse transcriptase domain-containing protein n=1 Tax=Tanacetum cinerariifolium TaxID=118510 RepID=A0A6L2N8K3_TANCI|nr:reverse transcriptase domain-containing protein [Tanacetum cinerariifolium]